MAPFGPNLQWRIGEFGFVSSTESRRRPGLSSADRLTAPIPLLSVSASPVRETTTGVSSRGGWMISAFTIPTSIHPKFKGSTNWAGKESVLTLSSILSLGKYTESVNLQFRLGTGLSPVAVTGFTQSDLNVTNGQVLNFTQVSDGNYTFDVRSDPWPGAVTVSLAADAATDANSFGTTPGSMTVDFIVEKVTQYDNLIAHWSFDEESGSRIFDLGPNGFDIPKIGTPTRTSAGKFGGALNFPSNNKRLIFQSRLTRRSKTWRCPFLFGSTGQITSGETIPPFFSSERIVRTRDQHSPPMEQQPRLF